MIMKGRVVSINKGDRIIALCDDFIKEWNTDILTA